MAASVQEREKERKMRSERERQAMNTVAKVKNPSPIRPSPYMKRSAIHPAAHKTSPSRLSAPVSGAHKMKTPSKSPAMGCTSAPASSIRSPAGGVPALYPPLKAKREASSVSAGVSRERRSAPVIQRGPKISCTAPCVLIPVRLKRTGLKLLDPERVKNLTSASRLAVSGAVKGNIILHQTTGNKPPCWSRKQSTLPRSSGRQAESSRKMIGISSRRENISQAGGVKSLPSDEGTGGHKLSLQMNQMTLDDKGCDESRPCDDGQVYNGPPQPAQPGDGAHDSRNSSQDDVGNLEEYNIQDTEKSSHMTDLPVTSGKKEETEGNDVKQDSATLVTDCTYLHTGGDQETPTQSTSCHGEENRTTEDKPSDHTQSKSPGHDVVDGLCKTSSDTEPTTEAQEQGQSSHSLLKDTDTDGDNPQPVSGAAEGLLGEKVNTILGPYLPPDEQSATETENQELNHHIWSRTSDIIRQSQGVLVLTQSTEENAVFIPKLKFEFTPDNSIDWTMVGPPPLDSKKGAPTKSVDPRIVHACTPRGPTFSKSVVKKSFMLPAQDLHPGGSSDSALWLSRGDATRSSCRPLHRIVDLSISFQGKFEEQEIPADIPKILLTEEDHDED